MNTKGVRSAIDIIREASKADLIIVSLFLLPILLGSWSAFFDSFDFFKQHSGYKLAAISLLLVVYVMGLIIMKYRDSPEEKLKRARYHIENILKKRVRASFEYLSNQEPTYTPDFLKKIILKYPRVFHDCPIRNHGPGITLVEEVEDEKQTS